MDSYEIIYDRIVNECGGGIGSFPTVTVVLDDGSLRSYTLINSSSAPVEEDGMYFIELRADNSVTRSESTMAFPSPVDTADAGLLIIDFMYIYALHNYHFQLLDWFSL